MPANSKPRRRPRPGLQKGTDKLVPMEVVTAAVESVTGQDHILMMMPYIPTELEKPRHICWAGLKLFAGMRNEDIARIYDVQELTVLQAMQWMRRALTKKLKTYRPDIKDKIEQIRFICNTIWELQYKQPKVKVPKPKRGRPPKPKPPKLPKPPKPPIEDRPPRKRRGELLHDYRERVAQWQQERQGLSAA